MRLIPCIRQMNLHLLALTALLAATCMSTSLLASPLTAEWDDVGRVIVIADIHGDFAHFTQLLKESGVVNRRLKWAGGDAHLVQLGDVVDRGPDSRKVVDLLRALEKQALRKGGRVHALIGNHEAMMIQGDTRYTHPGEYAAFVDRRSPQRQARYYQATLDHLHEALPQGQLPHFDDAHRMQWEQQFPLGYVELRIAWSPQGEYGTWLLGHNAIVRIDDTLFVHGGLHPDYAKRPIQQINDQIRAELKQGEALSPEALANRQDGPLWYRGLALNGESCENLRGVEAALTAYGIRRIVIGHTPLAGAILPRFNGRVLIADAGLSSHYEGSRAALVIEQDSLYALHSGKRVPLAGPRVTYLQKLAESEPIAPLLARWLAQPDSLAVPDLSCPPLASGSITPDIAPEPLD